MLPGVTGLMILLIISLRLLISLFGMFRIIIQLQIVLFVVVSGASLALLRPIAKRSFNRNRTQTNVDALVGKTCLVTAPIDNLQSAGQVRLGDVEWSARSSSDDLISVGTQVRIDRVEGVKVFVTPVKVEVG